MKLKINLKKIIIVVAAAAAVDGLTYPRQESAVQADHLSTPKTIYKSRSGKINASIKCIDKSHKEYIFKFGNLKNKKQGEFFKEPQLYELKTTYTTPKKIQRKDMHVLKSIQQYNRSKFSYFATAYQHKGKTVYNIVLNFEPSSFKGVAYTHKNTVVYKLIERDF